MMLSLDNTSFFGMVERPQGSRTLFE